MDNVVCSIARLSRTTLAFVLVALLSSTASAADYLFTRIDVPGALQTQPNGINNRGDISGSYRPLDPVGGLVCGVSSDARCSFGFVFSGGVYRSVDVPGSRDTFVGGINNQVLDTCQLVGQLKVDPCGPI